MIRFDDRVADWVAKIIFGPNGQFGECTALGVWHDTKLVGGFVFHDWQPQWGTIEVSVASQTPKWMSREAMNIATEYVFDTCGCQMVIAHTRGDNEPAKRLMLAAGATEYNIPRLRGRDTAGSFLTLTDDAWKRSKFKR